jgi:hypothetical protein
MEIDFKKIRPLAGDRRNGFEEFCCQMAEKNVENVFPQNLVPHNFHRKEGKSGDAGVECYYVLPDGAEWGWQAKYFVDSLGSTQWSQIDKSVKAALDGHSRLAQYTICLPINLTDARVKGKLCQQDHWEKHKKKWIEWAQNKGQGANTCCGENMSYESSSWS